VWAPLYQVFSSLSSSHLFMRRRHSRCLPSRFRSPPLLFFLRLSRSYHPPLLWPFLLYDLHHRGLPRGHSAPSVSALYCPGRHNSAGLFSYRPGLVPLVSSAQSAATIAPLPVLMDTTICSANLEVQDSTWMAPRGVGHPLPSGRHGLY
jgi:hypothetical protein